MIAAQARGTYGALDVVGERDDPDRPTIAVDDGRAPDAGERWLLAAGG